MITHINQAKIDEVVWIHSIQDGSFGIVCFTNPEGEKKVYIGPAAGRDMDLDIRHIYNYGCPILAKSVETLAKHLGVIDA